MAPIELTKCGYDTFTVQEHYYTGVVIIVLSEVIIVHCVCD
jgi:hypothetical protein